MRSTELTKLNLANWGNLFRSAPDKLSDQALLSLDTNLHVAWNLRRNGKTVQFGEDIWTPEDLLELHLKVRREMSTRAFQHEIRDELDSATVPRLNDPEKPV